ncbi:MAG: nucleotidyltransferase domain-containing protein [Pseudomonadota bacterium]
MSLKCFEPSISAARRDEIAGALNDIEREHGVRILFAIESGSRAWGFPSPDSDYDVRFVYAHPVDWYLSLEPGRDVIERPIVGDLDINGWELRKALNLLRKPNPVMLEWLSSPIRYRWEAGVADRLIALAELTAPAAACVHHYLHLGEGQLRQHFEGRDTVGYKKYFYVLRPALALRWVRLNPSDAPPMNIQEMSARLSLEAEESAAIDQLVALKAVAREAGEGPRIAPLDRLIEAEFAHARRAAPATRRSGLYEKADALFRAILLEGRP